MAKYSRGILGPVRGTVGTVVGSSWRAIDYVRGKATSVRNPRTPAQLEQRGKFKTYTRFARGLLTAARVGLRAQAGRATEFNLLVRRIFNAGGSAGLLRLSSGVRPMVEGLAIAVQGGVATVTWDGNAGAADDFVLVGIAAEDLSHSDSRQVKLPEGRAEFTLPAGARAEWAYAFTADPRLRLVSDTAVARVK